MRYCLLATFLLVAHFNFLQAGNAISNEPLLQKLLSVNAEWSKQPEYGKIISIEKFSDNKSFNEWIATHLMLVEKTLSARDVSNLTSTQRSNRAKLLNELHGYWQQGVFPVNDYLPYKNPVFIDRIGTHCAVGYLMLQSGNDELAQAINTNEKFAFVHEIKTEGVKEWADENGFAIDELAWIQPGYPPTIPTEDLDGGLNGTVNTIAVDPSGQAVYVGGNFSQTTSGVTSSNVALWISGFAGWDWIPVGSGLNGTVHTLLLQNNMLYAGGEFTMAGTTPVNHVAVYDISLGQWQSLGSLDSTVRALAFYNGELYAGGNFTGFVSKWNGSQWIDIANGFLYGEGVRTLEIWNNLLVIGGNFELATGALRRHVAAYDGSQMGTLDFGTITPVNDFEKLNNTLYAACDFVNGSDTCALACYDSGVWQVKIKLVPDYYPPTGKSFRTMALYDSAIVLGGRFFYDGGFTFANNLVKYYRKINSWGVTYVDAIIAFANLDSSVNSIAIQSGNLYFGGNFVRNSAKVLNRIGIISDSYVGIPLFAPNETLKIYPNPATDFVRIKLSNNEVILQTELLDFTGRNIFSKPSSASSNSISLAHLPSGVYLLRALTKNGWGTARVVKE